MENICLCIHCVSCEGSPSPCVHRELYIPLAEIDALLASLKGEGYAFALPGEAAEKSGPVCSVTFDDGYSNIRSFLEIAEKYGIPFIVFLNSYNVVHQVPFIWDIWEATRTARWPISSANYRKLYESLSPDERALLQNDAHRPFTTEELKSFAAHSLVRLAPHGHTHQPFVGKYLEGMDAEIDRNLAFLAAYPSTLPWEFSLPCGFYTRSAARKLLVRFERLYTIDGGGFAAGDRIIHRISLISPVYGGSLRDQIRRSFGMKARLIRKAINTRYSNRVLYRI